MKIYTRKGDDGTTGLYFGGRVSKNSQRPSAYGDVDETQAAIGLARSSARSQSGGVELDEILTSIERDLWVLMADLATGAENRSKLDAGTTEVTQAMIDRLESIIDDVSARTTLPTEFVVPGETETGARLDLARTVARRAERTVLEIEDLSGLALAYMNRLSDVLWALARFADGEAVLSKDAQ